MKWFHFFSFEKFFLPPFSTVFSSSLSIRNKSNHRRCSIEKPLDTRRKLNLHNTFRRRSGHLMYVQFTSCAQGENCSWKIRNIHRKTPVLESPFNKVAVWRPSTLLKRESNTGFFLWILGHFKEDLFWRTSANDSFCRQF